jgi:hypothetical protein
VPRRLVGTLLVMLSAAALHAQELPESFCWRLMPGARVVSVQPEQEKIALSREGLPDMELTVPPEALIYDAATGRRLPLGAIREGDRIRAAFLPQVEGNIAGEVVVYPRPEAG